MYHSRSIWRYIGRDASGRVCGVRDLKGCVMVAILLVASLVIVGLAMRPTPRYTGDAIYGKYVAGKGCVSHD